MDTSEKVRTFSSFELLTTEILRDSQTNDMLAQRYAVRFIMLNNFSEFKALAKFMTNIGVDSLDLETLIDDGEDDSWITNDTLKRAIKACERSTFVTPFSELVRFYNDDDFRGFFNEIMLLEDIRHPKKRIYIPLIGLQNRFSDFLNHFARIRESAPVWRYDAEPQSVEVYFAKYKDFELPANDVQCQLNSLREWLRFWKVQAPQEKIVCTSIPIAAKYKYSKPDNIFNFTHIGSAYEFMTMFLGLSFPFGYREDDKKHWECLLHDLEKTALSSFAFDAFVRNAFNKVQMDAADVVREWSGNTDAYHRWLLRHYVLCTKCGEEAPYIRLCADAATDLDDANLLPNLVTTRLLFTDILANKRSEYAEERRHIILANASFFRQAITEEEQAWLFERIKEMVQQQSEFERALELCTGVFDFEKRLLIGWYAHHQDNRRLADIIKELYPDFAAYCTSVQPSHIAKECLWCVDYLSEYRTAKLKDKYTERIEEYVREKNGSSSDFYQWYYSFAESHGLLAELSAAEATRPDRVYWVDGLGAEFLPYVLYLIEREHSGMKVVRSQITRADLPTSTHHNRFEGETVRKFCALDELGHDAHMYQYLETLRKELDVLKEVVGEIIGSCKKEKCTVAIVSDHGLSCLSRKVPSKKYDGKFEHEGRYIATTAEAQSDSDYLVHQNEADGQWYKVALTHASLSKVPTHQVHGGCTPEEVLVPFILLSNKDEAGGTKYQVIPSSDDIVLSCPKVSVTIIPEPKGATLTCEGREYGMERVGTSWTALLQDVSEGAHTVDIKPEGAASVRLSINIIGVGGNTDIDDYFSL